MAAGTWSHSSDEVVSSLSRAWEFLSGKQTVFEPVVDAGAKPAYSEFSIFMPLDVIAPRRVAGIGVLINREDAMIVASHMFGIPKGGLKEEDLQDACCEVCNVFSDCFTSWIGGHSDVIIGLPYRASLEEYSAIRQESVLTFHYQSARAMEQINVLAYNTFSALQVK